MSSNVSISKKPPTPPRKGLVDACAASSKPVAPFIKIRCFDGTEFTLTGDTLEEWNYAFAICNNTVFAALTLEKELQLLADKDHVGASLSLDKVPSVKKFHYTCTSAKGQSLWSALKPFASNVASAMRDPAHPTVIHFNLVPTADDALPPNFTKKERVFPLSKRIDTVAHASTVDGVTGRLYEDQLNLGLSAVTSCCDLVLVDTLYASLTATTHEKARNIADDIKCRLRPYPMVDMAQLDGFLRAVRATFTPDANQTTDPFNQPQADITIVPRQKIAVGVVLNSLRAYFGQHVQHGCALDGNGGMTAKYDPLKGVTSAPAFVVVEVTIPASQIKDKVFQLVRARMILNASLATPPSAGPPLLIIAVNGLLEDAQKEIRNVRAMFQEFEKKESDMASYRRMIHVIHVPLVCIHLDLRKMSTKINAYHAETNAKIDAKHAESKTNIAALHVNTNAKIDANHAKTSNNFKTMNQKIDDAQAVTNKKIDANHAETKTNIAALHVNTNAKIDANHAETKKNIDKVMSQIDAMNKNMQKMNTDMNQNIQQMNSEMKTWSFFAAVIVVALMLLVWTVWSALVQYYSRKS